MAAPEARKIFKAVIEEILEQFTFMFVDEDEETFMKTDGSNFYHVVMAYDGHAEGVISLTAPDPLCRRIAANVLGVEEADVPKDACSDALRELLNIVAGKLTHDLYGEAAVCNLAVPLTYRVGTDKWRELVADSDNLQLVVEGSPMLAGLMFPAH